MNSRPGQKQVKIPLCKYALILPMFVGRTCGGSRAGVGGCHRVLWYLRKCQTWYKITEYDTSNSAFHKYTANNSIFFCRPVLPKPDMLVACGGASAAGALQQKRRGVFVVYVPPPISPSAFDVVVCGTHDYPHGRDNIITIAGSVGGISYPMCWHAQTKSRAKIRNNAASPYRPYHRRR